MNEDLAIAGERDPVAIALQQLGAERGFQLAQSVGDCRLRDAEPLGRAEQRTAARGFDEIAELAQADGAIHGA